MPVYTYKCAKCLKNFEISMSIVEYESEKPCPMCKSKCGRNYQAENVVGFMSDPRTLGSLAEQNTARRDREQ